MKKIKLFLAAMAAMVGLSAQAGEGWKNQSYSTEWATPTSGQTYYIYNVGAGTFLGGGRNYGTRTISTLDRIWVDGDATITPTENVDYALPFTLQQNSDGTWYLIHNGTNKANKYMFYEPGGNASYIDNNTTHAGSKWKIVSTENGYRLDMAAKEGQYFGIHATNLVSQTLAYTWADFADANSDKWIYWQFVPASEGSNIKTFSQLYPAKEAYAAARTTVLGFAANTSAYTDETGAAETLKAAVYAQDDVVDAATTVEAINDAKAAVYAAGNTFLSSIIITSGFDITNAWITNPAPGISGNMDGWTNSGSPTLQAQLYEYWQVSAGTTKQTLSNLPKGAYTLTAIAYTRDNMTATLYAGENTVKLVGCGSVNDRTQGSNWIAAGNGVNTLDFTLNEATESLEIGLIADNTTGDHWMCWRSFSLIYYGDPINLAKANLDKAVTAANTVDKTTIPAAAYAKIKEAVETNEGSYSTLEEYEAATNAINTAVATYASSEMVAAYMPTKSAWAIYNQTDYADAGNAKATLKAVLDAIDEKLNATDVTTASSGLTAAVETFITSVTLNEGAYFDVTNFFVTNPSVRQTTDGWTIENPNGVTQGQSNGKVANEETEFYQQNFKFYQTLNLSAGTWEFGVTGFHRAGNHSTYFYASEDKILIPGVGSDVVNNMAGAKTYFDNGNGKVALKFLIEEAGNVEIGIENQDTETDKWTIFRDFTLKYYGSPNYSIYQEQLEAAIAEANKVVEGSVPAPAYANLTNIVTENNKTYTKKADFLAAINAITTATTNTKALVAPYAEYLSVKTKVEALKSVEGYTETTSGATTTLTSAVAAADEAVNAATTAEAIAEQVTALKTAGKTFIGGVRSDGAHPFDITFLITNPSFDNNNATGWTANPAPGFQSYTNCEYYQTEFDINQTLTGMPKGNYELKVQAFQRPGWWNAVYTAYQAGTNNVSSVIYINEGQTTIKNLVSEGATDADHQWQNGNDSNNGTVYYANSMNGAAQAFKAGHYWNSVLTAVEGDLKFGFKSTKTHVDGDWTIFDNFQLYYYGQSINVAMNEAQAFSALADIEGANVTMARTSKVGYNTVALPFNLTEAQVKEVFGDEAEVYSYSDEGDANNTTVNFNKTTTAIEANVPVLVKASKEATEIKVDDVTVKTGAAKVEGTNFDFVGNYGGKITLAEGIWFVGNDALYKSAGNTNMKGFRAFLQAKEEVGGEVKLFIGGIETAISEINGEAAENGRQESDRKIKASPLTPPLCGRGKGD